MIISTSRLTRKRPSAQPCLNNPEKKARPGSPFASVADEHEYTSKLLLAKHARASIRKKWSVNYLVKNHSLAELAQMIDIPRTGPNAVKLSDM